MRLVLDEDDLMKLGQIERIMIEPVTYSSAPRYICNAMKLVFLSTEAREAFEDLFGPEDLKNDYGQYDTDGWWGRIAPEDTENDESIRARLIALDLFKEIYS